MLIDGLVVVFSACGAFVGLVAAALHVATIGGMRRMIRRYGLPTEPGDRLHDFTIDALAHNPDIAYRFGAYAVPPGHAALLRSRIHPDAAYTSVMVYDRLMQSVLVRPGGGPTLRSAEDIAVDADGRFVIVLATEDPGVPNWLDVHDAPEGVLCERHLGAVPEGEARIEVVPLAEVRAHL